MHVEQGLELVSGLRTESRKITKSTRDQPHKKVDHNNTNPTRTIIMLHIYGAILLRKMYFL